MGLSYKERAAQIMEHLVTHYSHGYSQYSRLGDGGLETITLSDGSQVTIATGDRDCSSAVVDAYKAAGVDCGGASYTGNMRSRMVATGNFVWHPMSSGYIAQRGDIYLNEIHHTAMCTSAVPDMLAQFSISENGTIDGQEGDQTGYESAIRTYYDYPWDGILECVKEDYEMITDDDVTRIADRVWTNATGSVTADRIYRNTSMLKAMCGIGAEDTSDPKNIAQKIRDLTIGRWERSLRILKGLSGVSQDDMTINEIKTPMYVSLSDETVEKLADSIAKKISEEQVTDND